MQYLYIEKFGLTALSKLYNEFTEMSVKKLLSNYAYNKR